METSLDDMKVQLATLPNEMKGPMAASLAAEDIDLGKAMARQVSLETRILAPLARLRQYRMDCGGLVTT